MCCSESQKKTPMKSFMLSHNDVWLIRGGDKINMLTLIIQIYSGILRGSVLNGEL